MSDKKQKGQSTPGPWEIRNLGNYEDYHVVAIDQKEDGKHVGNLYIASVKNRLMTYDEANAKLIASAPDMFAEIERLKAEKAELVKAVEIGLKHAEMAECFLVGKKNKPGCPVCRSNRPCDVEIVQQALAAAKGVKSDEK